MKNLNRTELEMYNTPNLKKMLLSSSQDNTIINDILKKRESEFFESVTQAAEYHESK